MTFQVQCVLSVVFPALEAALQGDEVLSHGRGLDFRHWKSGGQGRISRCESRDGQFDVVVDLGAVSLVVLESGAGVKCSVGLSFFGGVKSKVVGAGKIQSVQAPSRPIQSAIEGQAAPVNELAVVPF